MRLTSSEVEIIKGCARNRFGVDAVVRVFGSRGDDARHGGDIDIHVVVAQTELATHRRETEFLTDLEERLGERKVDVVPVPRGAVPTTLDVRAFATGLVL